MKILNDCDNFKLVLIEYVRRNLFNLLRHSVDELRNHNIISLFSLLNRRKNAGLLSLKIKHKFIDLFLGVMELI